MSATVMLVGGGTGGHVFPLVALAEAMAAIAPGVAIRFVGTARGLESRVIPARGWTLDLLDVEPMKGRSISGALRGALIASRATLLATSLVRQHHPALVVSVGGYAAGPIALAAAAMRVPLALIEPNRIAGLTQRLLQPLCDRIYTGFPEAIATLGRNAHKARALGIPLRRGFSPLPAQPRANREVRLLVMGGSQGAEPLNHRLPGVVADLVGRIAADDPTISLRVVHQAGRHHDVKLRDRYARAFDVAAARGAKIVPLDRVVEVVEFIDDVASKLSWSDLVIARSGALTCAEVCAIGRAAIYVPYPHAADDHQASNADALAQAGAAIAIRQENASIDAFVATILPLVVEPSRREAMADAARARGVPDAADKIARDLFDLASLPIASTAPTEVAHV